MKKIAIIHVSIPPDMRKHWKCVIPRFTKKAKWFEPFNEKGQTAIYCEVDMQNPKYDAFLALLEEHGLMYPNNGEDPDYEKMFQAVLESEGVSWSVIRIEHRYTDKELRGFPLLSLSVDRAEIDPWGPNYGTTYDLSQGCTACGTGAVQTSPFFAPRSSLPKTGLVCDSGTEKLVATPLAAALRAAHVTGLELRQVQSSRDHNPLPWWQIILEYTMPKMSPATRGVIRGDPPPCPHCQRDGHYETLREPQEIVYDRNDVVPDNIPDVVQSWEHFGQSWIDKEDFRRSRFAEPLVLVKPRVFDIFRRLKVRGARFDPVRIE